jgi:hypothetical protein
LDFLDNITYSSERAEGLPEPLKDYFTVGFYDNSKTFIILFLFGFVIVLLIAIKELFEYFLNRKKRQNQGIVTDVNTKNNQINIKVQNYEINSPNNENEGNEKEVFFKHLREQKFKKCSISATKQYFLINYFIRIYQLTMTKLTFTCLLIINNSDLPTIKSYDIFIAYIVLFAWLILLPVGLFTYLRRRALDLMSPDMIIRFGTLYLTYRGISKDVYAFIIQLKFAALPIICVYFSNFPDVQLFGLVILYLFNILFITIYMPFFKVNRVFSEAISEGVLMGFCIVILVLQLISSLKNSSIPRYILMLLILLVFLIRTYRIFYDTIFRIKNLRKIKAPKLIAIDVPYELKGEDHLENEKQKKKDKKMIKYNLIDKQLRGETMKLSQIKSGTIIEPDIQSEEKAEDKTQMSNNMSHNSHRRLLSQNKDKEKEISTVFDSKPHNDSKNNNDELVVKVPTNLNRNNSTQVRKDATSNNPEKGIEDEDKNNQNKISLNDSRTNRNSQIVNKKTTNPITRIMTKKTMNNGDVISNNKRSQHSADENIQFKKSFPNYDEISKNKQESNHNSSGVKEQSRNSFIKSLKSNELSEDKMEDLILVNYLNGSNIQNIKTIKSTWEIEEKYEEDFENISGAFNNNTIVSGINPIENMTKKKSFDKISKISKTPTGSVGSSMGGLFPKNPKKATNLEMIREEQIKSHSDEYIYARESE